MREADNYCPPRRPFFGSPFFEFWRFFTKKKFKNLVPGPPEGWEPPQALQNNPPDTPKWSPIDLKKVDFFRFFHFLFFLASGGRFHLRRCLCRRKNKVLSPTRRSAIWLWSGTRRARRPSRAASYAQRLCRSTAIADLLVGSRTLCVCRHRTLQGCSC